MGSLEHTIVACCHVMVPMTFYKNFSFIGASLNHTAT